MSFAEGIMFTLIIIFLKILSPQHQKLIVIKREVHLQNEADCFHVRWVQSEALDAKRQTSCV